MEVSEVVDGIKKILVGSDYHSTSPIVTRSSALLIVIFEEAVEALVFFFEFFNGEAALPETVYDFASSF